MPIKRRPKLKVSVTQSRRGLKSILGGLGRRARAAVQSILGKAEAGEKLTRREQQQIGQLESEGLVEIPHKPEPPRQRVFRGNQAELQIGNQTRTYPKNHPIVTGEMVPVQSSNVHSIGFRWNFDRPAQGSMIVRFLGTQERGQRSGPGAMYEYMDVHPDLFLSFLIANSKGEFVWDELRIRGTVSGHQYRYKLAALGSGGYVPRQAARVGTTEMYLPRQVRSIDTGDDHVLTGARGGRMRKSKLVKQELGRALRGKGFMAGGPMPNRGKPNRGRP